MFFYSENRIAMIQDVLVFSRQEIKDLIETDKIWHLSYPWVLISIFSTGLGFPALIGEYESKILAQKGCLDYLPVDFSDITKVDYDRIKGQYKKSKDRLKLFSKRQARKIIEFIDNFKNDSQDFILAIHCEAGVSRSGAVGVFACRYLNIDLRRFLALHPQVLPNPFVYDTLREVSGMDDCYHRFWDDPIPEDHKLILF